MGTRILGLFCAMVVAFGGLLVRLQLLSQTNSYAAAAQNQGNYILEVDKSRGLIFDCNFVPLVGQNTQYRAAVIPSPETAGLLFTGLNEEEREAMAKRFAGQKPFLTTVPEQLYAPGVEVFAVAQRYEENQPAAHIVGYLDGEGKGVSGIEAAFESQLSALGGSLQLRYPVDATGQMLGSGAPQIIEQGYRQPGGVVLSLDKELQQAAEQAAAEYFEKGAVVVMDIYTGELKVLASLPTYRPEEVAASLTDPAAPLINRALWEYSVGSTFKILVEATAIEHGYRGFVADCPGYVMVGNVRINCHNLAGHGEDIDQRAALEKSCNPYFVGLIGEIGGESVAYKAGELGFGRSVELAPGLISAPGRLPTFEELAIPGETANFGFGQGKLSATPIQIAQMVAAVANGGASVQPRLVLGMTQDSKTIAQSTPLYAPVQVIDPKAAALVRQDMISVVDNGSGKKALPALLGAGGKTASAQTGQFDPITKEELVHAWFAGFYPAEDPRYAIVVLAEEKNSGGDYAAPVFKAICDAIAAQGLLG